MMTSIQKARQALCEDSCKAVEEIESCLAKLKEGYTGNGKISEELKSIEANIELLKVALITFKSENVPESAESIVDKVLSGVL